MHLDEIAFIPYIEGESINSDELHNGFEIRTKARPFHLIAESESEKRIWCEEIELAIRAYISSSTDITPGWHHIAIKGTLSSAAMLGDTEELKKHLSLLEGKNKSIDDVDEHCMTALHWASISGHCANVHELLEAGAEIDSLNNGLNSSLLLSAAAGHTEVFLYLIEKGADVHLRNLRDRDALFMIISCCSKSKSVNVMIEMLVQKGIDIDMIDSTGAGPLHECAALNLPDHVSALMGYGANINKAHERSGLTPLQIACSVREPDPELVRIFLERGAFPNAKTASGICAMDMVLQTFASRHGFELGIEKMGYEKSSNDNDNKNKNNDDVEKFDFDMDQIADFAMTSLPVLMEIAKRGGRYNAKGLSKFRSSFIEAVYTAAKQWIDLKEPMEFPKFLVLNKLHSGHDKWTNDANSPHCLLCVGIFTWNNRRHHCRNCGILCCDSCSSKNLSYQDGNGGLESLRVCDGCFNSLLYSCQCRQIDYALTEKQKTAALKDANVRAKQKSENEGNEDNQKSSLFSWGGSSAGGGGGNGESKIVSTKNVHNETMDALIERGDKISQVHEKSQAMEEAASEFSKNAKKLLQQQKESSFW